MPLCTCPGHSGATEGFCYFHGFWAHSLISLLSTLLPHLPSSLCDWWCSPEAIAFLFRYFTPLNSVSFVDAAELFVGCDTQLPVIQLHQSFKGMTYSGSAVSVCVLATQFPVATFIHETSQMAEWGQIPSCKMEQTPSTFSHLLHTCRDTSILGLFWLFYVICFKRCRSCLSGSFLGFINIFSCLFFKEYRGFNNIPTPEYVSSWTICFSVPVGFL